MVQRTGPHALSVAAGLALDDVGLAVAFATDVVLVGFADVTLLPLSPESLVSPSTITVQIVHMLLQPVSFNTVYPTKHAACKKIALITRAAMGTRHNNVTKLHQ